MPINKSTKFATNPKTVPISFGSVQEMSEYDFLAVGDVVRTSGYYSPGDGGANDYEIVAAGTGVSDGGSFINLTASGLQAKGIFIGDVNVKQFGAVVDGVSDDTVPLQSAIDFGESVRIPESDDGLRLTSTIRIKKAISIRGNFIGVYEGAVGFRSYGAWFYLDHSGVGFSVEGDQTTLQSGIVFEQVGTYRNQPDPAPGWVPSPHNFDFELLHSDVQMKDVVLFNATKGVYHSEGSAGRLWIDGLKGHVFDVGIDIPKTFDVARISNVHFWPFWSFSSDVKDYTIRNLHAIKLGRCDNALLSNIFTIEALYGLYIYQTVDGTVSKLHLVNADFDVGSTGVLIDSGVSGATAQFSNLTIQGDINENGNYGVFVLGDNCEIEFSNVAIDKTLDNAILVTGSGNTFSFSNLAVADWNSSNTGFPAIESTVASNEIKVFGKITQAGGNGANLFGGSADYTYLSSKKGTSTLLSGNTSVVVNHGLSGLVPTLGDISVTPSSGGSGIEHFWISAPDATSFTINVGPAPTTNISFAWKVMLD